MAKRSKGSLLRTFQTELETRLRAAVAQLTGRVRDERLYAFALYTSHVDEYLYILASANTEEAIERRVDEYAQRDPSADVERLRRELRWNAPDWGYHDFAPGVGELEVPPADDVGGPALIYRAFVAALRTLDREGLFGEADARAQITLNVLCGDIGNDFFERGLRALNPRAVVDGYFTLPGGRRGDSSSA
jgi:hypothetical protein